MKRIACAFLFGSFVSAIPSFAQVQTAPAKATIAGTVLRVGTGDPIRGAKVKLIRVLNTPEPKVDRSPGEVSLDLEKLLAAIPTAVTDERGRFQINGIDPATYRIVAARNGFAKQEYGQRSFNRPGTMLNINAGQRIDDLVFRMTPAPTISGRIIDSTGEPLPGITVQAMRSTYDSTGKQTLQSAQSAKTNDLGEYRLYWLNPGRYYVSANAASSPFDTLAQVTSRASSQDNQDLNSIKSVFGADGPANQVVDSAFGMTYFPGTPDASRAAALDLQSAEVRADFTLSRSQRFRVRGRLIDAATGRPPRTGNVSVIPQNQGASSIFEMMFAGAAGMSQGHQYNPATGEFELRDVSAGSYTLMASDGSPPMMGTNRAQIPLEVGADVDNVLLTITSGITIRGRVRIEGDSPLPENAFAKLTLLLRSGTSESLLSSMVSGRTLARPLTDGSITINNVTPGNYTLSVMGMESGMYIKDARLGRLDILQGISISDRVDGPLEITLSTNAGQLTGTVVDKSGRLVTGSQTVVLIPDSFRDRPDLYKTADTGADGHFTIRGITPGNYRIFAWEDIEPFAYFDPQVLKAYETQGKPIRIQENSKDIIEVTIIPAN